MSLSRCGEQRLLREEDVQMFQMLEEKEKKKKTRFRTDRDVIQIINMRLDDWQGRHFFSMQLL